MTGPAAAGNVIVEVVRVYAFTPFDPAAPGMPFSPGDPGTSTNCGVSQAQSQFDASDMVNLLPLETSRVNICLFGRKNPKAVVKSFARRGPKGRRVRLLPKFLTRRAFYE